MANVSSQCWQESRKAWLLNERKKETSECSIDYFDCNGHEWPALETNICPRAAVAYIIIVCHILPTPNCLKHSCKVLQSQHCCKWTEFQTWNTLNSMDRVQRNLQYQKLAPSLQEKRHDRSLHLNMLCALQAVQHHHHHITKQAQFNAHLIFQL